MRELRWPRLLAVAWIVLGVAYAVSHIAAIWTESVNWDEFILLYRAEKAARTGVLDSGGRPGLVVVLLAPFVDGCSSAMSTVQAMRIVWAFITLALFAGVFELARRAAWSAPRPWEAAALGTTAFALVPVVLRWSVQVRTDQLAICLALWGGVAALASHRRASWAVLAGVLVGTGYLCSQKALYVAGLTGFVVVADHWRRGDWVFRREVLRIALAITGAVVAVVAYRAIVPMLYTAPTPVGLERGLDLFRWYRSFFGYRVYAGLLPTLWPQILMLGLVVLALARASRVRGAALRTVGVAVVCALLGLGVGAFHAGAFPYFVITLGVFLAVSVAIAWGPVLELVPRTGPRIALVAVSWMLLHAVPYRHETLIDTQRVQRETLADAEALPATWRGFHPEGALVCRPDPSPLPFFVSESLAVRFQGPRAAEETARLLDEMRDRPVAFLVRTHRLTAFPLPLVKFWNSHFVHYRGQLSLAGTKVEGPPGFQQVVDFHVAGRYRWWSDGAVLSVDGKPLRPGEAIDLPAGVHTLLLAQGGGGSLMLATDRPPTPAGTGSFYDGMALPEISGSRRDW